MRKLATVFVLVVALLTASLSGCARQRATDPSTDSGSGLRPQRGSFAPGEASVEMVDAKTGWAITSDAVRRTTDGGLHWAAVTPPAPKLQEPLMQTYGPAAFVDGDRAQIALVHAASPTEIVLYRTADGGATWQTGKLGAQTQTQDNPTPKSLGYADGQLGWMLVNYGGAAMGSEMVAIYTTDDGGSNWRTATLVTPSDTRPERLPLGGFKDGVTFANRNLGFVAGTWYGDGIWLYATYDGGQTWRRAGLPVPRGYSTGGGAARTAAPMFFADLGLIPAVFSPEKSIVFFATSDGGATWKATTPVSSGTDDCSFAWSFVDGNRGWLSDGWSLYSTSDGGSKWTELKATQRLAELRQGGFRLVELDFIDTANGWALLRNGSPADGKYSLLRTADGGATWSDCADPNASGR